MNFLFLIYIKRSCGCTTSSLVFFIVRLAHDVTLVTACLCFLAAVDCGTLHAPMNGSLHGDLTVFPESVRFSCDVGFIMSGPPVRHCQSNGSWSGNETVCNGKIIKL